MMQMEPLATPGSPVDWATPGTFAPKVATDAVNAAATTAGMVAATDRSHRTESTATGTAPPTLSAFRIGNQLRTSDDAFLRTCDPRLRAQLARLPLLARMPWPLLVSGEPGTGRRCLARRLARLVVPPASESIAERNDPSKQYDVVELDARSLSSAEIEKQLEDFFHTAVRTILVVLEVHLLSPRAQAALLALCDAGARSANRKNELSAGESGGGDTRRIIATADDRLEEHTRAGTFDSPLLAHLSAINVRMPRLRERSGDIVPLAMLFLQWECEKAGRPLPVLTPGAVSRLLAHPWHGNVPELHAVMHAAFARCRKHSIAGDDVRLGEMSRSSDTAVASLRDAKRQLVLRFERSVLENLLQTSQGNIAKAARLAQKNRRAFFELLRKHGIDAARFREPRPAGPDGAIEISIDSVRD